MTTRIVEYYHYHRNRTEDALHFARKHEQRVWGSGSEHEKARAEVERLEARLEEIATSLAMWKISK